MTNLYPTPRAPDEVFERWRQERLARELARQHAHDLELARQAQGQVTRAIFWSVLLASSTARKTVFWIGAVVLVLGLVLTLDDGSVGVVGMVIGGILMGTAGIAWVGSRLIAGVIHEFSGDTRS
jgi:hypothetical protein